MCRFVLYLGPPLTVSSLLLDPSHSLIRQSVQAREREEPLNGDGFGITWYVPDLSHQPATFRSVSPAWNNRNLLDLARVTRSHCILAHVRAATQATDVSESNCHPFTSGPYAFMHNGDLGGFSAIRRAVLGRLGDEAFNVVRGTTDSEHLFALVVDHLAHHPAHDARDLAAALVAGVDEALSIARSAGIDEPSYLNIAISNGYAAAACRVTTDDPEHAESLYMHSGRRYVCEAGACRMVMPEAGRGAVIISSERLSDDPGWSMIPANHLVLVEPGGEVSLSAWPTVLRPSALAPAGC